ncbi:RNase A-like domain-containing protein [Clostridium botulinum]|uniref:RNase A-like domain-containing protein n=1 Tax=Clostridium botulinum TaxID=1491 RepID=UPI003DA4B39D
MFFSRHIGKMDEELLPRLASNLKITAASTFTDDIVADFAVNSALKDSGNVTKINNWLSKGGKGNLPISYTRDKIIGRGVQQGSNAVENLKNAKIILKNNGKGGFNILTSYPVK